MRRAALCALVLGCSLAGLPTSAQEPNSALLQCDGDELAVTFSVYGEVTTLPPQDIAEKWKGVPFSKDGKCALADGRQVLLLQHNYPGYAWGMGGADPPSAMKLWIDGRLVSSNMYKGGYGETWKAVTSVTFAGDTLSVCQQTQSTMGHMGIPTECKRTKIDFRNVPRDPDAPDFDDPRGGEISVISSERLQFCRSFIHVSSDASDESFVFVQREGARQMISTPLEGFREIRFEEMPPGKWSFDHPAVAHLDAFGIGGVQTAVRLSGDYKQFRGNFVMVRDGKATPEEIEALLAAGTNQYNKYFQADAKKLGWHHLGGEMSPFVWNTVFRKDGELLVMAVQENGYTNANPEPTAVLYKPFAAGTFRGAAKVCTFQMMSYF